MSAQLRVGQVITLTATADDPSGKLDPNAVDTWEESDATGAALPAPSGFVTLAPSGASCDATAVAAGGAFVVAVATDPDGNTVRSTPCALEVVASTDAVTVVITSGQPHAPGAAAAPAPLSTLPTGTPVTQPPAVTGTGDPSTAGNPTGTGPGPGSVVGAPGGPPA